MKSAKPALLEVPATLDAAACRRLAVEADCDPRTIIAVVQGRSVRGLVADRARAALVKAGYTVPEPTAEKR